jgi:hypothetical protein
VLALPVAPKSWVDEERMAQGQVQLAWACVTLCPSVDTCRSNPAQVRIVSTALLGLKQRLGTEAQQVGRGISFNTSLLLESLW